MSNDSLIDKFQKLEATMVCGVEWVKSEDVQALIRQHTAAPTESAHGKNRMWNDGIWWVPEGRTVETNMGGSSSGSDEELNGDSSATTDSPANHNRRKTPRQHGDCSEIRVVSMTSLRDVLIDHFDGNGVAAGNLMERISQYAFRTTEPVSVSLVKQAIDYWLDSDDDEQLTNAATAALKAAGVAYVE
jgi:hypothetical protein